MINSSNLFRYVGNCSVTSAKSFISVGACDRCVRYCGDLLRQTLFNMDRLCTSAHAALTRLLRQRASEMIQTGAALARGCPWVRIPSLL